MGCSRESFEAMLADRRNAALFRRYGTRERTDEPMYTCTACGRAVSIDGSMSDQGRDLVCNACAANGCTLAGLKEVLADADARRR